MLPTRTRRPRPPGIRRAPLRTLDGEAPPLPIKVPLIDTDLKGKQKATTSPPACKDIKLASDNYTASPRRPPMRNRPLSMQSEASSLASPPPPYAHGGMLLPSPDHKTSPMAIPPPPPDAFESGPSSVRTSMMEVENILDEEDDEPGNTLTLRGVQKLIRQHDLGESHLERRTTDNRQHGARSLLAATTIHCLSRCQAAGYAQHALAKSIPQTPSRRVT